MTPDRRAAICRIIAEKATVHRELRRALTFQALRAILNRERIALLARPHPRLAELVPMLGQWAIIIDSEQAKECWTVLGAHELAHLWLHHDPFFDRSETTVYDGSPPWYDAVREEEADAFAELLMRGPVRAVIPATGTKRETRRTAQLPLEIADRRKSPVKPEAPIPSPREYERSVARGGAARITPSPSTWLRAPALSDHVSDDDRRITYDPSRRVMKFEDQSGHSWWVTNYRKTDVGWERIRDFMRPDITHRLFVDVAGVRRLYAFPNAREQRAYRVKHLDRQLAEARMPSVTGREKSAPTRVHTLPAKGP